MCRIINIQFQHPTSTDGYAVNRLVADSPPLDTNSVYCNLLQCSHFANSSIIAKSGEDVLGFISGYRIPARPDTLFVWQVVVSSKARGQGLASRLFQALLEKESCRDVRFIETTITKDNEASWALFRKLAKTLDATIEESVMFDRKDHFNEQHDSEHLLRIGPFSH